MHKAKLLLFLFFIATTPQLVVAQEQKNLSVQLNDLFRLADENNRSLKVSVYQEQLATESIQQEKNKLLPSVEASLSFSYNGDGWLSNRDFSHGMRAPIPDFGNNFAVEAKQIIYSGGAIKSSIALAKLNQQSATFELKKNKQDIRFVIAGYYLELLKLNNQKKVMVQNLFQTDKLIEQINAKYKQGSALQNNITRYELQKQSLELGLLKLQNTTTIINNELVKLLLLPKGTTLVVLKDSNPSSDEMINSDSWSQLANQNAPVLQQMQINVAKAKKGELLVKSEKLPQIFAFASDYLNGPILIEVPPINQNLNYWYAGVGLKYDIASLYKSQTKLKSSKIATQMAMESNEMVKEELATAIEAAYIRYLESIKVYQTQLKGVQLASENYDVVKNRYLNNLVLITEMLDAENAKIDAELQAINAQINILFQQYQLKKLSGTL
jgi:outer membrane protein